MKNRYSDNDCECDYLFRKHGDVFLYIDITSDDGLSIEHMDFMLKFYVYGNPEILQIKKNELFVSEGKYYAIFNEKQFASGWLFCDATINNGIKACVNTGILLGSCPHTNGSNSNVGQIGGEGYYITIQKVQSIPGIPGDDPLAEGVTISSNRTWVVNGVDTGYSVAPFVKVIDNKLNYSYDNVNWTECSDNIAHWFRINGNKLQISSDQVLWEDISDYLAGYFRFNVTSSDIQSGSIGKIQVSNDNKTWQDLSPEFRNYLRIQGYVETTSALPKNQVVGTIYGVNEGTNTYSLHVWDGSKWVNNGTFTSIAAGVVQKTGDSETEVMSQKAVTEKLSELGSEVDGLSKDVDNLKAETSNSYKLVDITDELSKGAYVFTGRKGNALSASELNDGSFRRIKVDVVSGDRFVLTGVGAGQHYSPSERVTKDLTSSVKNGTYTYSSTTIGEVTTATHSYNGGWKCIEQPVKAGDTITITGNGGGEARLYCLVDNENVIQSIAGSGEVQSGYTVNVAKDGILYCSFDKNFTYSLIWSYTNTVVSDVAGARLFCLTDENGYILDIADVDEKASNLELVIKGSGFLYINVLTSYDYSLLKYVKRLDAIEGNIAELDKRMSDTEQQLKELEEILTETKQENLTTSVISGYYTFSSLVIGESATATRNYGGGWRCIEQPVKANERYIITGMGGGGARLYCLVSSAGVIKAIAESDEAQSNFELVVDEDGILYCNFDNSNNYALVKEYTVTISTESVSSIWANGSYEFGGTCNLDYTAPDIDRYSLPSAGKIVNAVYAWYDGLVSAFPNYVFREDCDAVMATLGISKPSAISDLPMYMYKFIPPKSPNSSSFAAVDSDANRIKAFIITGAHPEYTAVWDCYNAMKLVCEKWKEDKNLEELRWNADIYIIPCYNLYGVNNTTRTNENGVDLNRNAPTKEWAVQGSLGDSIYSGTEAGSEYSTKVLIHYLGEIKPQIFIDHHNTNVGAGTSEGDGKNMIYTHCIYQLGIDISNVLISQMTRKWKMRFPETFPSADSDNTMFGYTLFDHIKGSIGRYCAEQGCLGSTYESNFGILYKNGVYSTSNRQTNTPLVSTCATEGFVNYLLRSLHSYSAFVGVNDLKL